MELASTFVVILLTSIAAFQDQKTGYIHDAVPAFLGAFGLGTAFFAHGLEAAAWSFIFGFSALIVSGMLWARKELKAGDVLLLGALGFNLQPFMLAALFGIAMAATKLGNKKKVRFAPYILASLYLLLLYLGHSAL